MYIECSVLFNLAQTRYPTSFNCLLHVFAQNTGWMSYLESGAWWTSKNFSIIIENVIATILDDLVAKISETSEIMDIVVSVVDWMEIIYDDLYSFNGYQSWVSILFMFWTDIHNILLIIQILYKKWICETKKTKYIVPRLFKTTIWRYVEKRLVETKKSGGCQDQNQLRLSKSCRDRHFIKSLTNHW